MLKFYVKRYAGYTGVYPARQTKIRQDYTFDFKILITPRKHLLPSILKCYNWKINILGNWISSFWRINDKLKIYINYFTSLTFLISTITQYYFYGDMQPPCLAVSTVGHERGGSGFWFAVGPIWKMKVFRLLLVRMTS